ncbi:MAG: PAS domain S-box protein [Prolixibacteraceae bacterium]|nr:PAS domain S-box protein [Prolixibacteraceae bacterium]
MENKSIRILAIDDNRDNLITLKALIGESFPDAAIYTETDGSRGLEAAEFHQPDVILLDILMPGMDGFEVCRKLKADPNLADIPVVFITALKGDKESRIRALECGGEAFLAKPIDESELTAQIRAMVKIRIANIEKRDEKERLAALVVERTSQLEKELAERKKAIDALKESEERFKHVFEVANVGKSITLPNGEINVNQAFCDMLGYSKEELVHKKWQEITPEDEIPIIKQHLSPLLKGEKNNARFKKRYIHKNGTIVWTDVSTVIKRDPQGNPLHFITTINDISESIKAEEQIRESEVQYHNLADSGMALIWSAGLDKLCFYFNQPWLKFTGRTLEQELGNGWTEGVHPDDLDACVQTYVEAFDRMEPFDMEYRLRHVSGEYRWIQDLGTPNYDRNGVFVGYIGHCFDITNRKQTENEFRKLSRALEQSPDSILITDTRGNIEFVNPALLKLSGYTKEELIGKNPRIFKSGETSREEYAAMWHTISSGKVWEGELHNRKKNGELFWETATISPVFNSKGMITNYLAIRKDITAQKLMTDELVQAKERAEESDRLKSAFLANMSHEIRTPMNSIMGFASLLPEEESRELMCEYANIIVKNSEQLVSLIDNIVLYSKLQTGVYVNKVSPFEAHLLLNDIQQSFNLPSYQENVILQYVCNIHKATIIHTDYDKLRQIITNLMTNAFKYTPKGVIQVGCNLKGEFYEFYVKDTGIGIPPKDLEHIFDRFYRGSNVNEAVTRGTGLGLSIVKELVQLLGGQIWVESELNAGSTFYFTIPVHPR